MLWLLLGETGAEGLGRKASVEGYLWGRLGSNCARE